MTKRVGAVAILIVAFAAVGGLVIWKSRGSGSPSAAKAGASTAHGASVPPGRGAAATAQAATAIVSVKGPAGALAGATVRFARDGGDVITVDAGPDGTAKAASLEPGSWTISASAAGYEPGAADERELKAGETARIDITLVAGGRTLKGTVTDATGGPIAGARIDAAKLGTLTAPSAAVASTLTGATGDYTLSVAEGQLLVAASEPSYAPQSRYVDVGPAGAVASFALVPGGVIEGVVRDEQSREPVAGATVEARRDQPAMALGDRALVHAVTSADGRFRVAGLRPGNYNLGAHAGPKMSRAPTTLGIGVAEQVSDVEILITKGPSVRGTVVDDKGAAVADASVSIYGEGMRGRSQRYSSDARGAFAIEGLQAGEYQVTASTETHIPGPSVPVKVETTDVTGIVVTVRAGIALKGHVEPRQICEVTPDTDGDGPMMSMLAAPVTTGADGAFTFPRMEPIAYVLEARCPGGEQGQAKVTAAPNAGETVIEVKPGASIAGRVVDGAGKPVAGVKVAATPTGGTDKTTIVNGMITSGVQALTTGQGTFEIRGLHAGAYRLGALENGKPLPSKGGDTKVTLGATEKKSGVTLTVDRPDGAIRGVVTGPDGKPLAEAWVSLHVGLEDMLAAQSTGHEESGSRMVRIEMSDDDESGDAASLAPVLTNASGAFEISGLARTQVTVVAEAPQGKLRGQAMRVVPDAQITIQALALTELRGTVKAPGGKAPAWFTVELDGPTREQRNFASGDGAFSFARVDPGSYTVSVTSPAGNGQAQVTIVAGQPASVEIVLAANAIIIGKLVDPAGKPLAEAPLTVIPDLGDGHTRISISGPPATSAADGTFRIEAKAGKSGLIVMTPGPPTSRMGLVLEAGKTLDVGTITVGAPPP
jgi:protocatechuate 3,4-dioxygenase beta subunit